MLILIEEKFDDILATPPGNGGVPAFDQTKLETNLITAVARAIWAADIGRRTTNSKQSDPPKTTVDLAARLVKNSVHSHHQRVKRFIHSRNPPTTSAAAKAAKGGPASRSQGNARGLTNGKRAVPGPPAQTGGPDKDRRASSKVVHSNRPRGDDTSPSSTLAKKSRPNPPSSGGGQVSDNHQLFPFEFVKNNAPWEVLTVRSGGDQSGQKGRMASSARVEGESEGKSVEESVGAAGKTRTEAPSPESTRGAVLGSDKTTEAPTSVLLPSIKPLQIALTMSTIPEEHQRVNLIVAGHDAKLTRKAAVVASAFVRAARMNFPGSVTADSKVLWMSEEIPDTFNDVRLALQVSGPLFSTVLRINMC